MGRFRFIPRYLLALVLFLLSSCTFLSNRERVEQYPTYQGIRRVVIFLQRWPSYRQLPRQNDLGANFIRKETPFFGPWEPAASPDPRAVDIEDVDDALVGELIIQVLEKKGYQPFLSEIVGLPADGEVTVARIMSQYQAMDSQVDAFLFCFYSPTLYLADANALPQEDRRRPHSLQGINRMLRPGGDSVTWAGSRAALAPKHAISHAFIYLSLTLFKALDWQPLILVADSQVGGKLWRWLPQCLPAPTDLDYQADPAMIQRLMCDNLRCRLRHLIPDAFQKIAVSYGKENHSSN
ncbi:MAG: hypothetical protein FJ134_10885 [Deltaproteobacteria bacterium]|nr:hypothetical protein [Deltaproteobacteria bacterium]